MSEQFDLLPLPAVKRVQLKRPPLVLALCQVQFTPVLSVADPAFVAPFQRAIQDRYPYGGIVSSVGLQLQVGLGEASGQPLAPSFHWEFADGDATWKVVLAPNSLALETRRYTDFGEYLDRLRMVLAALSEHIRPSLGTRIGLRYINEIRPDGTNWEHVITKELLGPLAVPAFNTYAEQIVGVQQLVLRYPNNQGITINHGVLPGGTTVRLRPGEQMPEGSFYLLDCDVYRDFPMSGGLYMEPQRIRIQVEAYHDVIYRLFRWSITDDYLSALATSEGE